MRLITRWLLRRNDESRGKEKMGKIDRLLILSFLKISKSCSNALLNRREVKRREGKVAFTRVAFAARLEKERKRPR